ncbi:g7757 [Coccomyxa elongata]
MSSNVFTSTESSPRAWLHHQSVAATAPVSRTSASQSTGQRAPPARGCTISRLPLPHLSVGFRPAKAQAPDIRIRGASLSGKLAYPRPFNQDCDLLIMFDGCFEPAAGPAGQTNCCC